jgi:proteasome activator subunit 4
MPLQRLLILTEVINELFQLQLAPVLQSPPGVPMKPTLTTNMIHMQSITRPNGSESLDYVNKYKFLLQWYAEVLSGHRSAGLYQIGDKILIPCLEAVENSEPKLQAMAGAITKLYGNILQNSRTVGDAAMELVTLLKEQSTAWQKKIRILLIVQNFFFRNFLIVSIDLKRTLLSTICELITDPNLEVRNLASITLSGVIRCSEWQAVEDLLAQFTAKFHSTTKSTKDVIVRHGAVLGIVALILAFPFEVPAWMPKCLVLLIPCISDVTPISVN